MPNPIHRSARLDAIVCLIQRHRPELDRGEWAALAVAAAELGGLRALDRSTLRRRFAEQWARDDEEQGRALKG